MKIVAYTALHYGKDYLAYAIQSIIDHIDEYHVLYSASGSHGTQVNIPCPESREELYAIAQTVAGSKLRWHDGNWRQENEQRESIYQYAPDADVIIVLDADEIWPSDLVQGAIELAKMNSQIKTWRVPIVHYWRSFYRCVLHDPAYPVRVIRPVGLGTAEIPVDLYINHMGYAQRPQIVEYKMKIHGHKHQLKPNWFETVFLDKNRTTDLHPVGSQFWSYEQVDPLDYLPLFMASHPYFKMDWIE